MLTIAHQAGDDGRLFGSVTSQDIVDAIKEARGIDDRPRHVQLDEPIKTVGTHMVVVEVADGVTATVKTMVVEHRPERTQRFERPPSGRRCSSGEPVGLARERTFGPIVSDLARLRP